MTRGMIIYYLFVEFLGGYLLPQLHADDINKPCMVIDLDETLVHSSFKVQLKLGFRM